MQGYVVVGGAGIVCRLYGFSGFRVFNNQLHLVWAPDPAVYLLKHECGDVIVLLPTTLPTLPVM